MKIIRIESFGADFFVSIFFTNERFPIFYAILFTV